MKNFNIQRLSALFFGMAASTVIAADVSLKGDAKLTGEITSIASDGTITLLSPISEKALILSADQVERVTFGNAVESIELPEQRIELSNGDILPVRVNSMEGDLFGVDSPVLGSLSIPQHVVSSLQLGIVPKKIIYAGPKGIDGWSHEGSSAQVWNYENGRFFATGQGGLTRDFDLPQKFILKFAFGSQGNPHFQFSFAYQPLKGGARQDRYTAEFTGSGFGIFRETKDGHRIPISSLILSSEQLEKRLINVEIRVDRTRGLLELHMDGELMGRYTDPLEFIPEGGSVSLVSNASVKTGQYVRDLMILEWDDRGDRHRSEDRGDGKADSLIGRYGERFGGKLESIRANGGSTVYVFKSDFQKESLELPEEEVSTLFLNHLGRASKSEITGDLILGLRGQGRMRVSSITLSGDSLKVEHPLLGSLELGLDGVSFLERISIPKAKTVINR